MILILDGQIDGVFCPKQFIYNDEESVPLPDGDFPDDGESELDDNIIY